MFQQPEEMTRLLTLAMRDDYLGAITRGWIIRELFEARCAPDFSTLEVKIDPAFKRRLDRHLEDAELVASEDMPIITATNMRQSNGH